MPDRLTTAVIFLDITAILMTGGWVVYGVYRGVEFLEIFYNYIYVTVVLSSYILSIFKLAIQK